MQSFVPRDAFALKIQRELCHPKYARQVSGLSRNGPLALVSLCPLGKETSLYAVSLHPGV